MESFALPPHTEIGKLVNPFVGGIKIKWYAAPRGCCVNFGHYIFSRLFLRLLFSRFWNFFSEITFWFFSLLCRIYTCRATQHQSAICEKNSNKKREKSNMKKVSVKNQKREKSNSAKTLILSTKILILAKSWSCRSGSEISQWRFYPLSRGQNQKISLYSCSSCQKPLDT